MAILQGEAEAPEENLQEPVDALRVAGWGTKNFFTFVILYYTFVLLSKNQM